MVIKMNKNQLNEFLEKTLADLRASEAKFDEDKLKDFILECLETMEQARCQSRKYLDIIDELTNTGQDSLKCYKFMGTLFGMIFPFHIALWPDFPHMPEEMQKFIIGMADDYKEAYKEIYVKKYKKVVEEAEHAI